MYRGIRAVKTNLAMTGILLTSLFAFWYSLPHFPVFTYASLSIGFPRISRPFADHGKCATGMMKKLFPVSAIPARALYQARKAANRPK